MLNHYTYLLEYSDGMLYHGVRSCECPIEEDPYYGSSKVTPNEIPNKTILTTHNVRTEALAEEIRYHKELNVKDNPRYYNRANQTSTGFDFDRTGSTFKLTPEQNEKRRLSHVGSKRSKESCENIRNGQLGKILSEEHKTKLSKSHLGKTHSTETKMKMSKSATGIKNGFYGRTHSDEYKAKLSERMSNSGGTNHWSWVAHTYG